MKPIAAGEKVVAGLTSRTVDLLRRHCGDAVAVEMEGFGFLDAAYRNKSLDALVVCGISDLIGDKDAVADDTWRPVAASHAAAFAFTVLDEAGGATDEAVAGPAVTHIDGIQSSVGRPTRERRRERDPAGDNQAYTHGGRRSPCTRGGSRRQGQQPGTARVGCAWC